MDVILPPKQSVSFDATILSSLMGCGRFTDIRFNHRLVQARGKSNSLEVGQLIHKILEVYYKQKINGLSHSQAIGQAMTAGQLFIIGCPHCANVIELTEGQELPCKHEPQEYPGMQNTPERNDGGVTGWQFALQTCDQYFEMYKNDSFIPLSVEHVKKEVLYEDDEIRVGWRAKFDLILDNNQTGIVSMDHKTMKQRRDKTKLSNQFIGHCLLLGSRNVIVNKIGLQTSLKIEERLTRELVSYSADALEEWKTEILPYYAYKYLQYAESGYWPPNFSHCDTIYGSCQYKSVCESNRNMREEVLRNEFTVAPVWNPRNRDDE